MSLKTQSFYYAHIEQMNYDIKQSSGIYAASETKQSANKDTLIKFFLYSDICSLCNTTQNNEQYVPIAGYCRQLPKEK